MSAPPEKPRAPAVVAPGPATVAGQVTSPEGSGVEGLHVTIADRWTVTGTDGFFALAGLPAGRLRMDVAGPGYLPVALEVDAPAANVKVEVGRAVAIAGRVTLDGQPAAGAEVEAGSQAATSGADGRFLLDALPEGRYAVVARREALAAVAEVDRLGPGPFDDVALALAPAAAVAGKVVDDLGLPVAGARIVVLAPLEGAAARRTRASADGGFLVEGLPPGERSLAVDAPGFLPPPRQALVLQAGATASATVTLHRGALVTGRVFDADGGAVPGAVVEVVSVDGRTVVSAAERARRAAWVAGLPAAGGRLLPVGELGVMVGAIPFPPAAGTPPPPRSTALDASGSGLVAAPDGSFRIDAVPPGRVFVRAAAPGYARGESAPFEARSGETANAGITLRRGAVVVIDVVDETGRPVSGAQARIAGGFAVTGADGRARFEQVAGAPTVVVDASGRRHAEKALAPPRDGETVEETVTLVAAPVVDTSTTGTVRLDVRDELTRGGVSAFTATARGPGGLEQKKSGSRGELVLGPLVAGTWTIRVEARGFAVAEGAAEVAAGLETPLALEMSVGATVGGTVYDEHGDPVAGATVTCGPVHATTSATGAFRLAGVPTGEVVVTAAQPNAGRGQLRLSLGAGDEVLTLALAVAP